MDEIFVMTARAEDVLRVLQRITSLIARGRLQLQEIKVFPQDSLEKPNLSLTLKTDEKKAMQLKKQLEKMTDLSDVQLQKCEEKSKACCLWGVCLPHLNDEEIKKMYTTCYIAF